MKKDDENLSVRLSTASNLYASEILCATWFSVSLVLLTIALLFYDMTKRSSLKIHYVLAVIFAVTLMSLSIIACITGTIDYAKRIQKQIKQSKLDFKQEKSMSIVVTFLGIVLTIVEIGIAIALIKSLFEPQFNK